MTHIIDSVSLGKIVQIRDQLLRQQANGQKVYRFESGDPSFDIAPHIREALKKAVNDGKTHYTPNTGIPELRAAILNKLEKKNGIKIPSIDNIFVTNGAMNGLFATFFSLIDPGDEVLLPEPMWTEIGENIKIAGGTPIPVYLSLEENYEYTLEKLKERITPRTKAIFINYPHNPTGAVISEKKMRDIIRLARSHNLYIISDEAYEDVVYEPYYHISPAALALDYSDKIISIFSFSKSYAMSGLRLGYVVTTAELIMKRLPKILRCSINGTNSTAQWAAIAAVEGDQSFISEMLQEYHVRRDLFYEALHDIDGIEVFLPRGTFYMFVKLQPRIYQQFAVENAEQLADRLASQGIGCTPGNAFGESCQDFLRFAFSCNTEMVQEGTRVLRELLLSASPIDPVESF